MSSKDALKKMQLLSAIKKVASLSAFIQNAKAAGNPHRFGRQQNRSESQYSQACIFRELMKRDKYAYVGL